jgi:hypothetical protein
MIPRCAVVVLGFVGLCACGSEDSARASQLRDALGKTQLSLAQSISVVEATPDVKLLPTHASLVAEVDPHFTIRANGADGAAREIQIDKLGKITASNAVGPPSTTCPGPTSLKDATDIAERATAGRAIQIQPDDDNACFYEVQALAGSRIWEVKIDRSGHVVEMQDDDSAD